MTSQPAGITVEGADTLRRTLRQARHDLEDLTAAHDRAARLAAPRARALAPRRTGTLSRSISGTGRGTEATITATARHARPIHAGVPSRGIAARPFLADAVDQTQPRLLAVYADAVKKAVNQIRGL